MQGSALLQQIPATDEAPCCSPGCSNLQHLLQLGQHAGHAAERAAWPVSMPCHGTFPDGMGMQEAANFRQAQAKSAAQHQPRHPLRVACGIAQRQHASPGAGQQTPALNTQCQAQALQVGDQLIGVVACAAPTRARQAGPPLIGHDDSMPARLKGLHQVGLAAAARSAMQHQPGLARDGAKLAVGHEAVARGGNPGRSRPAGSRAVAQQAGSVWCKGVWHGIDIAVFLGLPLVQARAATRRQTYFMPTYTGDTDHAMDHTFIYRYALRLRNHDVHRQPLIQPTWDKAHRY